MRIDEVIRSRKTLKVRVDPEAALPVKKDKAFKNSVEELIELAGSAPFHHHSHEDQRQKELKGIEPWRFHAMDSKTCRELLGHLKKGVPVKSSEGILQMLATADALILVNWLPEPNNSPNRKYYPNVKNMEHIAATGAAIQNLLLAATERGIINYWSSGGCLRKPKVLEFLGVPAHEILLGAIFLFPDTDGDQIIKKTGKNRADRSDKSGWMNWLSLS